MTGNFFNRWNLPEKKKKREKTGRGEEVKQSGTQNPTHCKGKRRFQKSKNCQSPEIREGITESWGNAEQQMSWLTVCINRSILEAENHSHEIVGLCTLPNPSIHYFSMSVVLMAFAFSRLTSKSIYIHTHTRMCVYIYVYTVYMYIYLYVCVCICIYIKTRTSLVVQWVRIHLLM